MHLQVDQQAQKGPGISVGPGSGPGPWSWAFLSCPVLSVFADALVDASKMHLVLLKKSNFSCC